LALIGRRRACFLRGALKSNVALRGFSVLGKWLPRFLGAITLRFPDDADNVCSYAVSPLEISPRPLRTDDPPRIPCIYVGSVGQS